MDGGKMEKALEKHLEETCRMPGVTGAVCVDQHGLILTARGQGLRYASGPVASLAHQASTLTTPSTNPVIVIESQNGKTLIKQEDNITTAIFKS
ncbi:ragulator complex protein LAMTOR5-like [Babylonia areolata]|uniref:ragulator complex protein LAMTOR5-like n=1 Tax=Babylonia areolata TaxID=304850 RepID=UPI003FD2EADA